MCGKYARGGEKPCTMFYVVFEYFVNKKKYEFFYEVSKKGHNYPKSDFKYRLGNTELLRYDSRDPKKAYFHSFISVFTFPFVMLVFSILFGITTLKFIKDEKLETIK